MTEQELRRRVCRQAESWLGRREADGSHRAIIDLYNTIRPLPRGYRMGYEDPWCAAFVSAVGAALGLTAVLLPECGCEPMIALYRAAGRFEEDDGFLPAPGDLVFYDWEDPGAGDCRGGADHVGLVTAVEGERITVIEGNCADAVTRRVIPRDGRFLRGFARPDYAAGACLPLEGKVPPQGADEVEMSDSPCLPLEGKVPPQGADEVEMSDSPAETPPCHCEHRDAREARDDPSSAVSHTGRGNPHPSSSTTGETDCHDSDVGHCLAMTDAGGEQSEPTGSSLRPVLLPLLRRGDTGPAVEAAQLLLIARGYTCGPWGADGDFGAATFGAVYRFQQARALRPDGVVGPETWPALVGETT